jgi:hypothetical protein
MKRTAMTFENKLELHYYFNDKSQYMDALIRHRCEREILTIIRSLSEMLDVKMTAYSEHIDRESGFTDLWSIAGENSRSISILLNAAIQILTRPTLTPKGQVVVPFTDQSEELMQKDLLQFRRNLKSNAFATMSPELMKLLCAATRFIKCKSTFYESIKGYPKITKFTIRELNGNNYSRSGSIEIRRENFDLYILRTDELPTIKDSSATIQIISPVLGDVKLRWKGIYEKTGQIIDFNMQDDDFRQQLIDNQISFIHGFCIDCILEISRKVSELGTPVNVGYNVLTVIRTRFGKVESVTPQGKRHLRELEAEKRQLSLNLFS